MSRGSSRAEEIMRQKHPEERTSVRVPLHLSGALRTSAEGLTDHLVLVRDISFSGVFFYSNFKPTIKSDVQISFSVPVAGRDVKISCEGEVVRVEESTSNAYGIAVKLHHCGFVPTTSS